jgi:hypothetical protein
MRTTKSDEPVEAAIFPGWSIEASKDSMLVAWAILQAIAELKDVAGAIREILAKWKEDDFAEQRAMLAVLQAWEANDIDALSKAVSALRPFCPPQL